MEQARWEYAHFFFKAGVGATRDVTFPDHSHMGRIATDELLDTLNRLGEDGWEIAAAHLASNMSLENNFYLKRRVE